MHDYPRQVFVRDIVTNFNQGLHLFPPLEIELRYYDDRNLYKSESGAANVSFVKTDQKDRQVIMKIHEPEMENYPQVVLEGLFIHETACCAMRLQRELYEINYMQDIFPLFPVLGSAADIVQQILHHIKNALVFQMATKLMLNLGYGKNMNAYLDYLIHPSRKKEEEYEQMYSHAWIRSIFLSRLLGPFLASDLVSRADPWENEMISKWWDCHPYISPHDAGVLETMAEIVHNWSSSHEKKLTVQLFVIVKKRLMFA